MWRSRKNGRPLRNALAYVRQGLATCLLQAIRESPGGRCYDRTMPRRYATRKRLHAIELLNSGAKPRAVARQLRVHLATVYRWRNARLAEVRASAIASRPMVVDVLLAARRGTAWPTIHNIQAVNDYTWGGAKVHVLLPKMHEAMKGILERTLSEDDRVARALDHARQQLEALGSPRQVPPRGTEAWSSLRKYLEIHEEVRAAIDAVLDRALTREVKTRTGPRRIRT